MFTFVLDEKGTLDFLHLCQSYLSVDQLLLQIHLMSL